MTESLSHTATSERPATADAGGARAGATLGDLRIRPLAYADLPQVIAVERQAFPTPWSLAMFVLELSKPSGICLAATLGNRVVGYLICSRYAPVWHLMNVAVDARARRRGVATALIKRLFEEADAESAQYTLEVRMSNRPAIAMYERFGFHAGGRRRGYYHDNREDALIMWRTVDGDGARSKAR
jgi:ribosomal-protein-alanine N-acetyltransferase